MQHLWKRQKKTWTKSWGASEVSSTTAQLTSWGEFQAVVQGWQLSPLEAPWVQEKELRGWGHRTSWDSGPWGARKPWTSTECPHLEENDLRLEKPICSDPGIKKKNLNHPKIRGNSPSTHTWLGISSTSTWQTGNTHVHRVLRIFQKGWP